jgi:Outer membrane protein beta-barrel domain
MNLRTAILLGILLLFGSAVYAQDFQKVEVSGEYSYLRFNPTLSYLKNRSFNGGGGGFQYNFKEYFGIKGEFMGYGSTNFTIPAGTYNIPKLSPNPIVVRAPITTQGNMFTYQFGPVVRVPISKVTPFGELLFGGSNSNAYGNQIKAICNGITCTPAATNVSGTQHPFTMVLGGGLDIKVSNHVSIRPIEIDYVLTRYTNPLTSTNNQNSFRYLAGAVFHF